MGAGIKLGLLQEQKVRHHGVTPAAPDSFYFYSTVLVSMYTHCTSLGFHGENFIQIDYALWFEFGSQYPMTGGSQPPITPVPGDWMFCSLKHFQHVLHLHISSQNAHTYKIKVIQRYYYIRKEKLISYI